MSFTVHHEPLTDDDRAAIEKQAAEFESVGASPAVPLVVGFVGALVAAAGFRLSATSTVAAAAIMIGGCVFAAGGLLLAAGRKRFAQVMGAMADRLRRNIGDAEFVAVYEVEVDAATVVGGESDDKGEEWSGAVIHTRSGGVVFADAQVAMRLPYEDGRGVGMTRRLVVRALPTNEVISMAADGGAVEETVELSDEEVARLAAWVRGTDADAPPCREIPAGVLA